MSTPIIDRRQLLILGGGALLAAGAPALALARTRMETGFQAISDPGHS